jgi:hypothetical protein
VERGVVAAARDEGRRAGRPRRGGRGRLQCHNRRR